ncbi:MAG: hypothetical protein HZA22_01760 [Nitrospirae bacterium]|nr:hypothetical protein [Nitrospirota bacterium]
MTDKVDMFVNGGLGLWALREAGAGHVHNVFTFDADVEALATEMGVRVYTCDAHAADFVPARAGISVHYPRVFRKTFISRYARLYNIHPGCLPWGRGYYPVFWALWEDTPAGATLHEVAGELDAGPVVAQVEVAHYAHDTGWTLFQRVREAEKGLFRAWFPRIASGEPIQASAQPEGGTYHSKKDFYSLKQGLRLDEISSAGLVKLVRCLSFPGYTGLEVELDGKRFELRMEPSDRANGGEYQ